MIVVAKDCSVIFIKEVLLIKIDKEVWTVEMLDMLVNWINTDPRGEKYRNLDWSNEYEAARNNPNDTQTAL